MSEVKVTIEWNGNTAGLHPDPMKVQITAQADPNEVIGGEVKVGFPDGSTRSFPTWPEALDRIVVECEGANRG